MSKPTKLALIITFAAVTIILIAKGLFYKTPIYRKARINKNKIVLIGLDGAAWKVMQPLINQGRLPNIAKIVNNGSKGPLKAVGTMQSPVLWTTISTGKGEKKHGITDFVVKLAGEYEVLPVTSNLRRCKAFWNILTEYNKTTGVVNWFVSWPAEKVKGFIVSEHVFFSDLYEDRQFADKISDLTFPEEILQDILKSKKLFLKELDKEIINILGWMPSQPVLTPSLIFKRQLPPNSPGYKEEVITSLIPMFVRRDLLSGAAGNYLFGRYHPDLFAVYFWGIDPIQHFFWEFMEPKAAGCNFETTQEEIKKYDQVISKYYQFIDKLIGELLTKIDKDTTIIIVSDHGFHANLHWRDSKIYDLNFLFEKFGWLKYKNDQVDWLNTKVYDYTKGNAWFPYRHLYLNLKGREPQGFISPGIEYEELRQLIKQKLDNIKTVDGQKIFEVEIVQSAQRVEKKQQPDLTIRINPDMSYDAKFFIDNEIYPVAKFILPRPLSGEHQDEGIIIMSGKHIKRNVEIKGASVLDVTPTILGLSGIPIGKDMDGKVLSEAITDDYLVSSPIAYIDSHEDMMRPKSPSVLKSPINEEIKERLRSLGYIQ